MNNQQALQIIKATIDEALKAGVLKSMEQASAVLQAFSVIQTPQKHDSTTN